MPRSTPQSALGLSLPEREEISLGLLAGDSCRVIAERLGRSPSTVARRRGGRPSRAVSRMADDAPMAEREAGVGDASVEVVAEALHHRRQFALVGGHEVVAEHRGECWRRRLVAAAGPQRDLRPLALWGFAAEICASDGRGTAGGERAGSTSRRRESGPAPRRSRRTAGAAMAGPRHRVQGAMALPAQRHPRFVGRERAIEFLQITV